MLKNNLFILFILFYFIFILYMTTYTFDVQPIALNSPNSQFVYSIGGATPVQIKSNYTYMNGRGQGMNTGRTFNQADFKNTQIQRCILDMKKDSVIKDAVVPPGTFNALISPMYGISDAQIPKFPTALSNMKQQIEYSAPIKATNVTWSKINKIPNALEYRNIFIESGKNPNDFLAPGWIQQGNLASVIFDPAGRPQLRDGDEIWPPINYGFKFTQNLLGCFGFPNSLGDVEGKTIQLPGGGGPSFEYSIPIARKVGKTGHPINHNNADSVRFFSGNPSKNRMIIAGNDLDGESLLICKEMGDVFQVLLMWAWSIITENKDYTIFTCDHVVYLLCQILGLNCIIPSTDKDNKGEEWRVLTVYRPSLLTQAAIKKKQLEIEYKNIKKSNDLQILIVDTIINGKAPDIIVYGYDGFFDITGRLEAFKKIKKDMEQINIRVTAHYNQDLNTVDGDTAVDVLIKDFKTNYRIFDIFKYNKNKTKITLNSSKKAYTHTNPFPNAPFLLGNPMYNTKSIYRFIVDHNPNLGGGSKHRRAPSKLTQTKETNFFSPRHEYLNRLEIKKIERINQKIINIILKFPFETYTNLSQLGDWRPSSVLTKSKIEDKKFYEEYYDKYVDIIIQYSQSSYNDDDPAAGLFGEPSVPTTPTSDSIRIDLTKKLKENISKSLPVNFATKYPDINMLIWDNLMEEFYFDNEVCWNDTSDTSNPIQIYSGKLHQKIYKIVHEWGVSIVEMGMVVKNEGGQVLYHPQAQGTFVNGIIAANTFFHVTIPARIRKHHEKARALKRQSARAKKHTKKRARVKQQKQKRARALTQQVSRSHTPTNPRRTSKRYTSSPVISTKAKRVAQGLYDRDWNVLGTVLKKLLKTKALDEPLINTILALLEKATITVQLKDAISTVSKIMISPDVSPKMKMKAKALVHKWKNKSKKKKTTQGPRRLSRRT
jgi:hypothetical protein